MMHPASSFLNRVPALLALGVLLVLAPAALASDHGGESAAPAGEHGAAGEAAASELEEGGLNLGAFAIDDFEPSRRMTPHVEFHLFLVLDDEASPAARRDLLHWKERLRDQAIIAIRGAEPAALAEPTLIRVRRLILLRLRRLPLPAEVTDVYLTDFSVEDKE